MSSVRDWCPNFEGLFNNNTNDTLVYYLWCLENTNRQQICGLVKSICRFPNYNTHMRCLWAGFPGCGFQTRFRFTGFTMQPIQLAVLFNVQVVKRKILLPSNTPPADQFSRCCRVEVSKLNEVFKTYKLDNLTGVLFNIQICKMREESPTSFSTSCPAQMLVDPAFRSQS